MFSALTRKAIEDVKKEGVQFIFNTPNQNSLPGYLKMGWTIVGALPLYFKVLSPFSFIAKKVFRNRQKISFAGPAVKQDFFTDKVDTWGAFIEKYGSRAGSMITDWESIRGSRGYRTLRSREYYQWRYGGHPHVQYYVYAVSDRKGLSGFVIFRPNYRDGLKEVVITDLCLREQDMTLARAVLNGAARNIRAEYIVGHFSQGAPEMDFLKRTGFWRLPFKRMIFTAFPLQETAQDVLELQNWDFSMGDLEVF